jgi:hypothetical protein
MHRAMWSIKACICNSFVEFLFSRWSLNISLSEIVVYGRVALDDVITFMRDWTKPLNCANVQYSPTVSNFAESGRESDHIARLNKTVQPKGTPFEIWTPLVVSLLCVLTFRTISQWISQKMTICLWHEGKMFYFSIPRTVSRQVTDEPRSLLRLHKIKYYLIPLCIAEVPT